MLPKGGFQSLKVWDEDPYAKADWVKVQSKQFAMAWRVTTIKGAKNPWTSQLVANSGQAIKKGDVVLADFWLRCIKSKLESGDGTVSFVFHEAHEPWLKALWFEASTGPKWQRFQIPFTANGSFAVGEAKIAFWVGYDDQTVEIGNLKLSNYGPERDMNRLPKTHRFYRGHEKNALWRKEALARIENIRTADLAVQVFNAEGQAVKDAIVEIAMVKSAFHFGSAVQGFRFRPEAIDADDIKYRAVVKEFFDMITPENSLKWRAVDLEWGEWWAPRHGKAAIAWARKHGKDAHGHVLIWPSWQHVPKAIKKLENKPKALRAALFKRIADATKEHRGTLTHWDVLNEPFAHHDFMDIFGNDILVEFFIAAHQGDPDAKLFINDFNILSGGERDTEHRRHYEKMIQLLLDGGAPVQAVGLQSHMGRNLTAPVKLLNLLDRYGRFGLPLLSTEYDYGMIDDELAGDYTRDFLIALYSHASVEGVILWGFWDKAHWKNNGPLMYKDFSLKPAGKMWKEWVLKRWRTKGSGLTSAKGMKKFKGHLGQYSVTAVKGKKKGQVSARLKKGGSQVHVILK